MERGGTYFSFQLPGHILSLRDVKEGARLKPRPWWNAVYWLSLCGLRTELRNCPGSHWLLWLLTPASASIRCSRDFSIGKSVREVISIWIPSSQTTVSCVKLTKTGFGRPQMHMNAVYMEEGAREKKAWTNHYLEDRRPSRTQEH